jgi:hypothetical protein
MPQQDSQRLALSIVQFLSTSLRDGSLSSEKSEREVAATGWSSCFSFKSNQITTTGTPAQQIAKAFNIDVADDIQHQQLSIVPVALQSIFDNHLDAAITTEVCFLQVYVDPTTNSTA